MTESASRRVPGWSPVGGRHDRGSRWAPWLGRLAVTALVAAPIVWVWTSARGSTAPAYPTSLLQSGGLVLTALVFILGFSQSHLRRAAEGVLADARRWEDHLAEAHRSEPGQISTSQVRSWARKDREALAFARYEVMSSPRDWSMSARRYSPFAEHAWLDESLDKGLDVDSIRRELERRADAPNAAFSRRRKYLEEEAAAIEAQRELLLSDAKELGFLTPGGLRPLIGRYRVAQATTGTLLRLVNAYVVVMVVVVVLGFVYAGWDGLSPPQPELWVALAFPALASTYARVVGDDVRREGAQLLVALENLWHVRLAETEHRIEDERREVQARVRASLEWVDVHARGLPWTASVRGRELLVRASASRRHWDTKDKGLELLDAAEQALRRALAGGDDPPAALALARTLEILSEIRPSRAGRVDGEIDRLVAAACQGLRVKSRLPGSDFFVNAAQRGQVQESRVLWPAKPCRAARLEEVVGPRKRD